MTATGRLTVGAVAAGAALGIAYTLSPITVIALPLLAMMIWRTGRGMSGRELHWFAAVLTLAVTLRLAMIAVLFLLADPGKPFATLFGDELFFKNRTLWMRNVALGVPISTADLIYAFENVGESSYLYLLDYLQALVGAAPYGIHVMNATCYVAGVLIAYRIVRPAYGAAAAMAGLVVLLFWPSLAIWSVSALKEPIYTLVAVLAFWCAVQMVRASQWRPRLAAAAGVVASALLLEGIRRGGGVVAIVGVVLGLLLGRIGHRPKLILAAFLASLLTGAAALTVPAVQERAVALARQSAIYHAGHVGTPGYSYQLIDPRYYLDSRLIFAMPPREAALFVGRAIVHYFIEPLPWKAESRQLRVYLPEQMLWLLMLAFVPIGVVAGMRSDPRLTSLLIAHACGAVLVVALNSGNFGTLIRHRGLALPYLAWLAGVGAVELLRVVSSARQSVAGGTPAHGHS